MKIKKNISPLALFSMLIMVNGCSSHSDIVAVSEVHEYSHQYGLVKDARADAIIQNEILTQNIPIKQTIVLDDPSYSTTLMDDPEAFTADEFVPKPTIITYKYKFDEKFYDKAIWRTME